jgi:hypothetical protein
MTCVINSVHVVVFHSYMLYILPTKLIIQIQQICGEYRHLGDEGEGVRSINPNTSSAKVLSHVSTAAASQSITKVPKESSVLDLHV